jgi:hypothetical protein
MKMLEAPFRALGQIGPRLIMIAAMVTSYSTQLHLFRSWQVDSLTAFVAPAVVDILAITCAEILHDQYVIRGKRSAGFVLAVAGAGSMAANWIAGATAGSKVVHASMVLGYVLAELVVGSVKRRESAPAVVSEAASPVEEIEQLEDTAPVSPAVGGPQKAARGTRGDYGPRNGVEYADSTKRHKTAAAKKTVRQS